MVAFEFGGVEIDSCVDCRGTWLDTGELELIAEIEGVSHGELSEALAEAKGQRHGKRRCPRCGRKLRVIHLGEDGSIELDRCPSGHGVWLDKGEMERFVACFERGEEGAVARYLAELHGKSRAPHDTPENSPQS